MNYWNHKEIFGRLICSTEPNGSQEIKKLTIWLTTYRIPAKPDEIGNWGISKRPQSHMYALGLCKILQLFSILIGWSFGRVCDKGWGWSWARCGKWSKREQRSDFKLRWWELEVRDRRWKHGQEGGDESSRGLMIWLQEEDQWMRNCGYRSKIWYIFPESVEMKGTNVKIWSRILQVKSGRKKQHTKERKKWGQTRHFT